MEDILNVLKDYWQLILASVVFILSFILQLIKKKPVSDILSWIYDACIKEIKIVEASGIVGASEKLGICIKRVLKELETVFPNLEGAQFTKIVEKTIEDILSTPQKKGGK